MKTLFKKIGLLLSLQWVREVLLLRETNHRECDAAIHSFFIIKSIRKYGLLLRRRFRLRSSSFAGQVAPLIARTKLRDSKLQTLGYTLAELSISTSIIAVLAVGGLAVLQKKNDAEKLKTTLANLTKIDTAIKGFVRVKGYVPCPAIPALLESSANFGKSEAMTITGGVTVATTYDATTTHKCSNNGLVNETGSVPVRTLGLSDAYSYDGWGRKFTYRSAASSGAKIDYNNPLFRGNIDIVDLKGTSKTNINEPPPYNEGAIYVVISHGANGRDVAYRRGNATAPSEAAGIEAKNTQHNRPVYVQNEKTAKFDDIIIYGTAGKLGRQKIAESPIRIPDIACENARSIANKGLNDTALNNYATSNSNAYVNRAKDIYKSATMLGELCKNRQRGESVNPGRMSGLTLWLDAADASTLFTNSNCTTGGFPANAASIGCWKDKSGRGHNAVEATNQPAYTTNVLNGKPVLRFDGSDILATSAFDLGSATIFTIANATSTGVQVLYEFSTGCCGNGSFSLNNAINQTINKVAAGGQSGKNLTANWLYDLGKHSLMTHTFTDSHVSHKLYIDGTEASLTNGVTADPGPTAYSHSLYIGARSGLVAPLNGDIAEIIAYNSALSTTDRQKVEEYLSDKWGIQLGVATSTCSGGMVFQKTATDPAGSCRCPAGQVMSWDLATADACYPNVLNSTFGSCITKNPAPTYSSPSPPNKGALALWLDANDCTTITLDPITHAHTTTTVSRWADKSGSGNDAMQATTSKQPLYVTDVVNGKPVLRFDGTDDFLQTPAGTFDTVDFSAFIVYNFGVSPANRDLLGTGGTSNGHILFDHTVAKPDLVPWSSGSGNTIVAQHDTYVDTWYIISGMANTTDTSLYVNGSLETSAVLVPTRSSSTKPALIGNRTGAANGNYWSGDIAEVVIYNKALTNQERMDVEKYLSNKYAIIRYPNDGTLLTPLKLWLDASDGATILKSDTCSGALASMWDKVGCWKDKSGTNNATQATDGNKPLYAPGSMNGKPALQFNGSTTSLASPTSVFPADNSSFTLFAVTQTPVGGTPNQGMILTTKNTASGIVSNQQFGIAYHNTAYNYFSWWHNNGLSTANSSAPVNAANIVSYIYNSSTSTRGIYSNGGSYVSNVTARNNPDPVQAVVIGGGAYLPNAGVNYFIGNIGEIIIYSSPLATTDRQSIERYLGAKWGITVP